VSANVLHAQRNLISEVIAGWPPLALMLTVELISRVPTHRPLLAIVRLVATTVIAAIAAWVSYWHMAAVASRFGETGTSAYLLPISVDGLVVVASVCLVEIAGRMRVLDSPVVDRLPATVPAEPIEVIAVGGATASRARGALAPVPPDAFRRPSSTVQKGETTP
jgi:hypothetical protein